MIDLSSRVRGLNNGTRAFKEACEEMDIVVDEMVSSSVQAMRGDWVRNVKAVLDSMKATSHSISDQDVAAYRTQVSKLLSSFTRLNLNWRAESQLAEPDYLLPRSTTCSESWVYLSNRQQLKNPLVSLSSRRGRHSDTVSAVARCMQGQPSSRRILLRTLPIPPSFHLPGSTSPPS